MGQQDHTHEAAHDAAHEAARRRAGDPGDAARGAGRPDEERVHDVIEDAVAEHTQSSAGPEGVAASPQTSWLPHADHQAVTRPGVGHTVSAPSPHEPDVEDRRLAAQSTEDEPPVRLPPMDPRQGEGPARTRPAQESGEAEERAAGPRDRLQSAWHRLRRR